MEQAGNRRRFDRQIEKLDHDFVAMASLAEGMMELAIQSLSEMDMAAAWQVIQSDDRVDELEATIEGDCLLSLALENPLGSDLRKVSALLKMATDVERYADIAVDLAKTAMQLEKELEDASMLDLPMMGSAVTKLLREAVQCYVHEDRPRLDSLVDLEDEVDEIHRRLRDQIMMLLVESPEKASSAARLLLAVSLLERAGDLCLSLGDKVHFILTGELHGLSPTHRPRLVVVES